MPSGSFTVRSITTPDALLSCAWLAREAAATVEANTVGQPIGTFFDPETDPDPTTTIVAAAAMIASLAIRLGHDPTSLRAWADALEAHATRASNE